MTFRLAMHHASLEHIKPRLEQLDLNAQLITFDESSYYIDEQSLAPTEVDLDYVWLSWHISSKAADVFDLVLKTRSIDVLQTFNAGLDHPFYRKVADRGIRICNSNAQSVAISEYVIAQVLALFHPLERQRVQQSDRMWKLTPFRELSRTHWLIIGYGAIGSETGRRARSFGAQISAIRRSQTIDAEVDRVAPLDQLSTFLPDADVILLSCPLTAETRHVANDQFFASVKPGAVLVNVGRGGLVDETALLKALDEGRIEHAVLDVFETEPLPNDSPLWGHAKIHLTPHTSFSGDGVQARWDELFLENVARYARNEPLARVVNPDDI